MLAELFTWWAQQLRDVVPQRLRAAARPADATVVRADGEALLLWARRHGVETRLGPLAGRVRARPSGPVVLALPDAALLQQTASLPLAAERDLAAVLRHEMDRLTPFGADDLFWAWRVERRDRAAGRLSLRLLLVPKLAVAATLATLAAAGLRPTVLEAAGERVPLAAPGAAAGRSGRVAAWACAGLAAALCAVPVLRQEQAIAAAEARVESLRPQLALVDGLRRRLAANTSGSDLFAAESARTGSPLRAVAALTAALPDDTFLVTLAMRDRKLSMTGRSAAAARLIGTLDGDPDLRDAAFDAPVTRAGDKSDLFSIRATLAP